MVLVQIYWFILLALTAFLFVFITVLAPYSQVSEKSKGNVEKIVAYSFLKNIELQSEEVRCNYFVQSGTSFFEDSNSFLRRVDGTNVYVSSVNLDKRLHPFIFVRIVGMIKGKWDDSVFCQIQTIDGSYHVMKPTVTAMWSRGWDENDNHTYLNPVLLSCRVPTNVIPKTVSISREPCEVSNQKFRLSEDKKARRNFTVCLKPLNFLKDISKHLIQWIEINKILGAEHFHIYVGQVKRSLWKVLKWYKTNSPAQFTIRKFTAASTSPGTFLQNLWQKRRYEVVTYNNCFYQNLNSDFIIPLDLDEIIVPKNHLNWTAMFMEVFQTVPDNYVNFIVQNVYYFTKDAEKGTSEVFFLRHNERSILLSQKADNCKSFIDTSKALTVFNHYALQTLKPEISQSYFLPFELVQLSHYKDGCQSVILPRCSDFMSSRKIVDTVMFKYRKEFLQRYEEILKGMKKMQLDDFM